MIRDKDPSCCGGRLFMIAFCDWCGVQQQIPKPKEGAAVDPVEVLRKEWNWVTIFPGGDVDKVTSFHFHSRQCRAKFRDAGSI